MPTESWVVSGPQIIELDEIRALRVGLVGGRVDVVAHDDDSRGARVEVHEVSGRPLEVSLVDGELKVGYGHTLGGWENFLDRLRNFSDRDSAAVHIAVPRDVRVRLGTVTAEGLLAGVREDAQVSTVSGTVDVDRTLGALSAKTVSGEIAVRDHTGDLTLSTVSGDLTAAGALSRVTTNSVSGAVTLDLSSRTATVAATTVSGDITIRLPEGVGVGVEAKAVSGRVVVDGRDHTAGRPGRTRFDERSGGTGCYVTSTSVSGHLTILRAGVA